MLSGGIAPKPSVLLRRFVGGQHPEASIGSFHLFHGDLNSPQGLVLVCSWTGKRRAFGDLSACSNYLCKWWLYQKGSEPDSWKYLKGKRKVFLFPLRFLLFVLNEKPCQFFPTSYSRCPPRLWKPYTNINNSVLWACIIIAKCIVVFNVTPFWRA